MRCVIHIGTEKTATTLLQKWLYENRQALSDQGVALTERAGRGNNRKLVAYFSQRIDDYLRNRAIHDHAGRERFFRGFPEKMAEELHEKARTHGTCVLTSEHFHSRLRSVGEIGAFKAFLDGIFDDYTVVCYFREQSRVRTSLYSTALKVSYDKGIESFRRDVDAGDPYFNYSLFFGRWEEVFGREALLPRLFDRELFAGGDIRTDFLAHALPEVDAAALAFDTPEANTSLSAAEAALHRAINAARPKFPGPYPDPTPAAAKRAVRESGVAARGGGIVDPDQDAFYDLFDASNVAFFERYFGEARNLFPRPAGPRPRDDEGTIFEVEDMARLTRALLTIDGLAVLRPGEIDGLRDLAVRLHRDGAISAKEAVLMLRLAARARPDGGAIRARIDALREELSAE